MLDLVLVVATLLLGAVSIVYVRGCAALIEDERDER